MEEKVLNCYAKTCLFNNNLKCCAGEISIGNPSAVTTAEARCKMYEKNDNELKNTVNEDSSGLIYVHCTAKNCEHNNSRKCMAKEITINPAIASCDTFTPNNQIKY